MSDQAHQDTRHQHCGICSQLADWQSGFQCRRTEDENTFLPEAEKSLKVVRDLKPNFNGCMFLKQCPECGTYYLYTDEYEYLAFGSEDEQILQRLTDDQVAEYLVWPEEKRPPGCKLTSE